VSGDFANERSPKGDMGGFVKRARTTFQDKSKDKTAGTYRTGNEVCVDAGIPPHSNIGERPDAFWS